MSPAASEVGPTAKGNGARKLIAPIRPAVPLKWERQPVPGSTTLVVQPTVLESTARLPTSTKQDACEDLSPICLEDGDLVRSISNSTTSPDHTAIKINGLTDNAG